MDVGVAGTGERRFLATAPQQRVPVEPVGDGLERDEQTGENSELDSRGAADVAAAAGEPDPAEHVVGDQVRDEREDHRDEHPVQQEPVERQVERIEPDVETELRVALPNEPPFMNIWTVTQLACATRPDNRPSTMGMPSPNARIRVITVVRYRATGSLGPAVGTNTGRDR